MPDTPLTGDLRVALVHSVAELNEAQALKIVLARVQAQDDPLTIVEDCQEGLRQVGERYERREYYLSGLIMAGEISRQILEILAPAIDVLYTGQESGTILIGTVAGDIHDIGKNNLSLLLSSYGFTVYDIGVDASPDFFLNAALQQRPDVIGLSGLLTSSYDSMRETVRVLRACEDAQIRRIPIVIGGNQLNEQVCQYVGADAWVTDAMTGVRLCQRWLDKDETYNRLKSR
jgi:methanogenic corrinoid protein MtbC1